MQQVIDAILIDENPLDYICHQIENSRSRTKPKRYSKIHVVRIALFQTQQMALQRMNCDIAVRRLNVKLAMAAPGLNFKNHLNNIIYSDVLEVPRIGISFIFGM